MPKEKNSNEAASVFAQQVEQDEPQAQPQPEPEVKSVPAPVAKPQERNGLVGNLCHLQPAGRTVLVSKTGPAGKVVANVDAREYAIPEGTEGYVHVFPLEHQVPHTNMYVLPTPEPHRVVMLNPVSLLQAALKELVQNQAFEIRSLLDVYRILRNINEETVKERYEIELPDRKIGAVPFKKAVEALLAKKRTVIYGTKTFTAADILHLPVALPDQKTLDTLP